MKTTKTQKRPASNAHSSNPFFDKNGEGSFFPPLKESGKPFFNSHNNIQKKEETEESCEKAKHFGLDKIGEKKIVNEDGNKYEIEWISEDQYYNEVQDQNRKYKLKSFPWKKGVRCCFKYTPIESEISHPKEEEIVVLNGQFYKKINIEKEEYDLMKGKRSDKILYRSYADESGKRGVRHYFKYIPFDGTNIEKIPTIKPGPIPIEEPKIKELDPLEIPKKDPLEEHEHQPAPNLYIEFIGGETNFKNKDDALKEVQPLLEYLENHPEATVFLVGNSGSDNTPFKTGNSEEVLNQKTMVDGKDGTLRELQTGRAKRVADLLIEKGIDWQRIQFGPGSQGDKDENRNVGVEIR